jgi:hypothetical protein
MRKIASNIIAKCGGHRIVAEWTGVDISRVHRWTYPSERGGTGGVIPAKHQPTILDKARAAGVKLSPADFFEAA